MKGRKIDDKSNTVIGHEQLFFEDGHTPYNLGYFDDNTLRIEGNTSQYQKAHDLV